MQKCITKEHERKRILESLRKRIINAVDNVANITDVATVKRAQLTMATALP